MISRGVPLPSVFLSYQWGHWLLSLGGGGGGGYFVRILCFVYHCFICAVLVLVVYSIVSCSHMGCVLFLVLHAVVGSVSICLSYCASHILLMLVSQLLVVCLF